MKFDRKSKWILLGIIIIMVIIIIILGMLKSIKKTDSLESYNNTSNTEIQEKKSEEENKELIKKLKQVSESERIRIYLGTYFMHIENKEYSKAYDLLYKEFKNNYFPTLEDFKKYIQEQAYPDMLAVEYDEIEMRGEYYVVTVIVEDFLPDSDKLPIEKTLIVKENDYNDYFISFNI